MIWLFSLEITPWGKLIKGFGDGEGKDGGWGRKRENLKKILILVVPNSKTQPVEYNLTPFEPLIVLLLYGEENHRFCNATRVAGKEIKGRGEINQKACNYMHPCNNIHNNNHNNSHNNNSHNNNNSTKVDFSLIDFLFPFRNVGKETSSLAFRLGAEPEEAAAFMVKSAALRKPEVKYPLKQFIIKDVMDSLPRRLKTIVMKRVVPQSH